MTMGEYIKQLRLEHGLSQEELGKKAGVNRAAVNKWEQGTVENIKRSTIKKLSEVFGVSPCELMKWEEETQPKIKEVQQVIPSDLIKKHYGSDTYELVELFIKLNETGRAKAIENLSDLVQLPKYTETETAAGKKSKMA